MKKALIAVIFILTSVFAFVTLFVSERDFYRTELETVGENDNALMICFTTFGAPDVLYDKITGVLDTYGANLYVTRVAEVEGQTVLIKYVYINTLPMIRENVLLVGGRFFSESEKEADVFLSTNLNQENRKIGLIDSFPTNEVFEIRTMKSGLDATLFSQVFVLQPLQVKDADKIIADWDELGISVTRMDKAPASSVDFWMIYALIAVCLVVFSLVMFHDILQSNRRIAIAKIHGFSDFAIWIEKAFFTLVVLSVCALCVMLFGSLVVFQSWTPLAWSFLGQVALVLGIMLGLAVVFLSLPFFYIRYIKIAEILRKKRGTLSIISINAVVKLMTTTVLVICCSLTGSQTQALMNQYNKGFAKWQEARNYYTVSVESIRRDNPDQDNETSNTQPTGSSGSQPTGSAGSQGDRTDSTAGKTEEEREQEAAAQEAAAQEALARNKEIYQFFNRLHAVYADFEMYASYYEPQPHDYAYYAVINPNYLYKHALYDVQGNEVRVVEHSNEIFLLVPEQYRAKEWAIVDYYTQLESQNDKQVNVTWLKDDQSMFSYRYDIMPDNGNQVDNAILMVLTEANGVGGNYKAVTGSKGNPLKICAVDLNDARKQIQEQYGKHFDANTYRFPVADIYEVAAQQMMDLRGRILLYEILCGILVVIILLVLMQNMLGYISENRFRVALKHTLGFQILHKFESYFVMTLVIWGSVLIVSMVAHFRLITLLLCMGLFVLDMGLSLISFSVIQRRKVLRIMKGG
ncbi:MAG: DUF1430 domain-containing protein [Peptococcaceae bacterium]|nr:DUF1430 domain-containing protein [Peptococcaceae bacterium]